MADQDGRILCRPCAENINDTTTSNVAQRMVNQLKTKCLTLNDSLSCDAMNNSEDAEGTSKDFVATKLIDECEWIGTIESYNEHSKKCEFMMIECSECKTYQCRRKSMGKHLAECPESKIQCPLACGMSVIRKNKNIHLENECMEQLLDCSNDECKEQIKRKHFETHTNKECDLRIVECKFRAFGCNSDNIKANQLNEHLEEYKFEHLSNKMDFISNQFEAKMNQQQQTIDGLNLQLIAMNRMFLEQSRKYVVHNFSVMLLTSHGYECVYDKPYSHKTTSNELMSLCEDRKESEVFVGGIHVDNRNNVILGAFGPCSVLTKFTKSMSEAYIPSNIKHKHGYSVYWYHYKGRSFGFSPSSEINVCDPDRMDPDDDDRLCWRVNTYPGWRLGNKLNLSDEKYRKIIYMKRARG
eukprot:372870_1